jgi:hypothetical protein
MNPGLSAFTGLSTEANLYDRYRVLRWDIEYVPSNAVFTTAGIVYLAYDVDIGDGTPTTSAALTNYEGNVRDQVYEKICLRVPPNKVHEQVKSKKTRCGPIPGDYELTDVCTLLVATDDCANANDLGKLYLIYEIELLNRQYDIVARLPKNLNVRNLSANLSFTTGVAKNLDFDESIVSGFDISDASGVYTLPCGAFLITGTVIFRDTASETFTSTVELLVNGVSTSPPQAQTTAEASTASNHQQAFCFYASSADSFTIALSTTLTGAAGTLTAVGDNSRLAIQAF